VARGSLRSHGARELDVALPAGIRAIAPPDGSFVDDAVVRRSQFSTSIARAVPKQRGGVVTNPEILVVGSINTDLTIAVPRLPREGETILGGQTVRRAGGKGANQAVASARLGRVTGFVGCVGADAEAEALLGRLGDEGVDTTAVARTEGSSGIAVILLRDGESTIVVSPGANARLSEADVLQAGPALRAASAVLLSLEIPMAAVSAAARAAGGLVVLNPAPAQPLPADLLAGVDVLVPNRQELADLVGSPVAADPDTVAEQARRLPGEDVVVVTLGGDGALVVTPDKVSHVPAEPAPVVDATAAGDAFCAALTDALIGGADVEAAARWAVQVAAAVVERPGAMDSLPSREEVRRRTATGPHA
jgi:ribokinase